MPGTNRGRALVLVLVQPHPSVCIVDIDQADIWFDTHAGRSGDLLCQLAQVRGQRRDRQSVEIRARGLVLVGVRVPMPAEAEHADVHLAAATHDGTYAGTAPSTSTRHLSMTVRWLSTER